MNKKVLSIIAYFFFFLSCKDTTSYNCNKNEINLIESLKENKDFFLLSSIANSIDYIQLQSDTSCFLDRIRFPNRNIKFYNDRIFIADESKLLLFDSKGNFIKQFGQQGRGPGEYLDIWNFTLLPKKEKVVIFSSALQKSLFFNINGQFITDVKIDFLPTGMTSFNDKLIFITPKGRRNLSEYFSITVMSEDGDIGERLINRSNEREIERKEKISLSSSIYEAYVLNNTLHYWESFYDTIFNISDDFKIKSKTSINYGEDRLPFRYILESNKNNVTIEVLKNYIIPQYFLDTKRYMFFEFSNKGKRNHIFYDKNLGRSLNIGYKEELNENIHFSFFNDIDSGLPFWPDGVISDDKVFYIIYPLDLIKYYNRQITDNQKIIPKNGKLSKIMSSIKLTDNPILMVLTLK